MCGELHSVAQRVQMNASHTQHQGGQEWKVGAFWSWPRKCCLPGYGENTHKKSSHEPRAASRTKGLEGWKAGKRARSDCPDRAVALAGSRAGGTRLLPSGNAPRRCWTPRYVLLSFRAVCNCSRTSMRICSALLMSLQPGTRERLADSADWIVQTTRSAEHSPCGPLTVQSIRG